jgi:hypothetical protein
MSAKPRTARKNDVTLVRDGGGSEEFCLPEGATLADLLKAAQAVNPPHVVTINGRALEGFLVLQPGMVVSITPMIHGPITKHSWRESFGMFKDDPHFQELVDAGRAIREADRKAVTD